MDSKTCLEIAIQHSDQLAAAVEDQADHLDAFGNARLRIGRRGFPVVGARDVDSGGRCRWWWWWLVLWIAKPDERSQDVTLRG